MDQRRKNLHLLKGKVSMNPAPSLKGILLQFEGDF